jgi:uncharacterized membrane protein YadS
MAKLARVLMLAPVLVCLALAARWLDLDGAGKLRGAQAAVVLPRTRQAVPWFVLGFVALAALRSAAPIPDVVLWLCAEAANVLTLLAMAGLGLGADLRAVAGAGARTAFTAAAALTAMAVAAAGLIWMLGIA